MPQQLDVTTQTEQLYLEAVEYVQAYKFEKALEKLKDALRLDPKHAHSLSLYAVCLAQTTDECQEALDTAKTARDGKPMDLIMVNAKSDPPVCKIADYSKYRYAQEKKAKEIIVV